MFTRRRAAQPLAGDPAGQVAAVARTHVGRIRLVNEDRFLVRSDCGLWAVADGMGGQDAGAIAATMAIDTLDELANRDQEVGEDAVIDALMRANAAIFEMNESSGQSGGTTIVVVKRTRDGATIFWAGDSRAYWMRNSDAKLLTRDHSLVQEWVDAGLLDQESAQNHPRSNIITRALGVDGQLEIDLVACEFSEGDRIVLCSDGLSRSQKLGDFIAPQRNVAELADRLLTVALQRDGSDNATLVALERNVG